MSFGEAEREGSQNCGDCTSRRQTLRTATSTLESHRQMETMKKPLGKPQPANTCREKVGAEESAEWGEKDPGNHRLHPAGWYNQLAKGGDATDIKTTKPSAVEARVPQKIKAKKKFRKKQ